MMAAMTKQLSYRMTYDAPLDRVAAMLADKAFRERVCDAQRVLSKSVSITSDGGVTDVRIEQVQPATGIPSFATKFVGDSIEVIQEERWASPDRADVRITIPGKPGDATGTATLAESGGVTTETVELAVKVGIPLVGGKLEGLIHDLMLKALTAEERVGKAYLSGA